MTRILLDTSAYSAAKRGHPQVVRAVQEAEEIYLTPITLGELLAGFRRGRQRQRNEQELDAFIDSPRVGLLDIDSDTSERYAVIVDALRTAGTPIPTNDVWIAASAMQHGLALVTTDAHFQRVPQIVVDHHPAV